MLSSHLQNMCMCHVRFLQVICAHLLPYRWAVLYVHTVATYLATYQYILILFILDEVPELSDLNKIIVPKYAARWKDLGIELKIPLYYLEAIEVDYVHYKSYT